MELIELGSILEMTKGKKPITTVNAPGDGVLPYVDIDAFENHNIKQYTDGEKCVPCEDGDILIVCDGSRSGLVGRAVKGYVGSTLAKLSAEGMNSDYLYHFVQGKYALLNTRKKGTGTPHLNPELLKKQKLVVPSDDEQKRIVYRIEELFSELDVSEVNLKKLKYQLNVYRQAVLSDSFKSYSDFGKLESICESVFDGPFGSNLKGNDYVSSGIRVVRLENVKYGWFDDSKKSYVTEEKYSSIKKHTVFSSDLIMSTFITDCIKVCQIPNSIEYAINKADCVCIRLKEEICRKFVMYYLMSRKAYLGIMNEVHGATSPRVNSKQIKNIMIPIVDIEEQLKVAADIERKLTICDSIEVTIDNALTQAEALRQSILTNVFEGRLNI